MRSKAELKRQMYDRDRPWWRPFVPWIPFVMAMGFGGFGLFLWADVRVPWGMGVFIGLFLFGACLGQWLFKRLATLAQIKADLRARLNSE